MVSIKGLALALFFKGVHCFNVLLLALCIVRKPVSAVLRNSGVDATCIGSKLPLSPVSVRKATPSLRGCRTPLERFGICGKRLFFRAIPNILGLICFGCLAYSITLPLLRACYKGVTADSLYKRFYNSHVCLFCNRGRNRDNAALSAPNFTTSV